MVVGREYLSNLAKSPFLATGWLPFTPPHWYPIRRHSHKIQDSRGPSNTETAVVASVCRGVPVAECGAQILRKIVVPRTAAHNPQGALPLCPCNTCSRRTTVVRIPTILRPLPNVAVHIVKTKLIRFLRSNRVTLAARII